jgi:hypothetical protein
MADQPDSTYIYFVFDRAHFNHEIRLFIAPDAQGENRSAEWNQKLDLIPDRSRDVAYVFMGRYMGTAALVAQMYPGGREYRERDKDGNLLFEAYVLPRTAQGLPDAPR